MSELYTIKKETMTNIADSVRELTDTTEQMSAIDIANILEDKAQNGGFGIQLPELTNPGAASHLLAGKELIDQEGNIVTGTIPSQSSKTVTPTTTSQIAVASGVYTTGAITVEAIPSQYINTTDATAAANEIFKNETAYVNGSKVTGTFTIDSEVTEQNNLIAQIKTAISNKAAYNTIYIGSAAPESSIGADGDIYIVSGGTV